MLLPGHCTPLRIYLAVWVRTVLMLDPYGSQFFWLSPICQKAEDIIFRRCEEICPNLGLFGF